MTIITPSHHLPPTAASPCSQGDCRCLTMNRQEGEDNDRGERQVGGTTTGDDNNGRMMRPPAIRGLGDFLLLLSRFYILVAWNLLCYMMKLFYQWSENPFVNRRNSTPNVIKKTLLAGSFIPFKSLESWWNSTHVEECYFAYIKMKTIPFCGMVSG